MLVFGNYQRFCVLLLVLGLQLFPKFSAVFQKLRNCQKGNFAIMTAALLPAIVGGVGLTVDFVAVSRHTSNLQEAVDAAALRAAKELTLATGDNTYIDELAKTFVIVNLKSYPLKNIQVTTTNLTEPVGVKVDVSYSWEPIFAKYFNAEISPVKVSATASLAGKGGGLTCLIGLMPRLDRTSIHGDNDSILNAGDCYIQSNSPGYSIRVDANAKIIGKRICAVGRIFKYGLGSSFDPKPITDCPSMDDPLSGRLQPAVKACQHNGLKITEDTRLYPGVYCGGLTISDDAEVELSPGIYTIKDGPLIVADEAELEGKGVGFFLTGPDSLIEFQENTEIDLIAPTKGLMAGLLFFEDRNVPHSFIFDWRKILPLPPDVRLHRISSNNARRLLGTIYLSKSIFLVDSEAPVASDSAYTAIVAGRIWLQKGPVLTLNANYKDTNVPVPPGLLEDTIRLVK